LRVEWSPQALAKAAEIVDYIAADRPNAALDWLDGLEERLTALPGLPEQGRVVPEWYEPTVRELIYKRHRIIYEIHPDRVELLTIRHSRAQIEDGA
jgi:plasmid stabilization system protein ParE